MQVLFAQHARAYLCRHVCREVDIPGQTLSPLSHSATGLLQCVSALLAARHSAALRDGHNWRAAAARPAADLAPAAPTAMDVDGADAGADVAGARRGKRGDGTPSSKVAGKKRGAPADEQGDAASMQGPIAKRARGTSPLEDMLPRLGASPERWAPVLAMSVAQHAHVWGPLLTHLPSLPLSQQAELRCNASSVELQTRQRELWGSSAEAAQQLHDALGLTGQIGPLVQIQRVAVQQVCSWADGDGYTGSGGGQDQRGSGGAGAGWLLRLLAAVARAWRAAMQHPAMAVVYADVPAAAFAEYGSQCSIRVAQTVQRAHALLQEAAAGWQRLADSLTPWLQSTCATAAREAGSSSGGGGALPPLALEAAVTLAVLWHEGLAKRPTHPDQFLLSLASPAPPQPADSQRAGAQGTASAGIGLVVHSGLILVLLCPPVSHGTGFGGCVQQDAGQQAGSAWAGRQQLSALQQLVTACSNYTEAMGEGAGVAAQQDANAYRSAVAACYHLRLALECLLDTGQTCASHSHQFMGVLQGHHATPCNCMLQHGAHAPLQCLNSHDLLNSSHGLVPAWLHHVLPRGVTQFEHGVTCPASMGMHASEAAMLPMPVWCAWDSGAAAQQAQLALLLHGEDRARRAAHMAWARPKAGVTTTCMADAMGDASDVAAGTNDAASLSSVWQMQVAFVSRAAEQVSTLLQQLSAAPAAGSLDDPRARPAGQLTPTLVAPPATTQPRHAAAEGVVAGQQQQAAVQQVATAKSLLCCVAVLGDTATSIVSTALQRIVSSTFLTSDPTTHASQQSQCQSALELVRLIANPTIPGSESETVPSLLPLLRQALTQVTQLLMLQNASVSATKADILATSALAVSLQPLLTAAFAAVARLTRAAAALHGAAGHVGGGVANGGPGRPSGGRQGSQGDVQQVLHGEGWAEGLVRRTASQMVQLVQRVIQQAAEKSRPEVRTTHNPYMYSTALTTHTSCGLTYAGQTPWCV